VSSKRKSQARSIASAYVLASTLIAGSVLAQTPAEKDAARELLARGQELRDGGNLTGAIQALTQAHALATTPITALELARTHAQAGHLVEARELALSIARMSPGARESEATGIARKEGADLAETLRPRIATVNVRVQGVPAGHEVSLSVDGSPVAAAAVGAPLRLDPGHHVLAAHAGTGPEARAELTVTEGETKDATLVVQFVEEPHAEPSASRLDEASSAPAALSAEPGTSPFVWVGFGVTAVGVAAGSVTGLVALSKAKTSECDGTRCTGAGIDDINSGRTLATISTISFVVAAVGAAVGVYSLTWGAPKRTGLRVVPALAGASIVGAF
jgi:hypothetical protein